MDLISVILPVYNQEKYIAETIDSILKQTYSNFELIIVDDGSTDNSADIIRTYVDIDRRITAFFDSNVGKCSATNNLVLKANGKWCAFLDADDLMLPYRLEQQMAYHKANPEIDASSCNSYYINEDGKILGAQRHPYLKTEVESRRASANKEYIQCAFTGLFMSKKAFLESGGLISKFWPSEDFEFFNRLIDKKFVLVNMQEVLMKYRIHATSITVRRPLQTYDMTGYVMRCLDLRRSGKEEITFEEFMLERSKDSVWKKINRRRYNYSQIYFRNAGINMMSRNYVSGSFNLFIASVLDPLHVFHKALRFFAKSH